MEKNGAHGIRQQRTSTGTQSSLNNTVAPIRKSRSCEEKGFVPSVTDSRPQSATKPEPGARLVIRRTKSGSEVVEPQLKSPTVLSPLNYDDADVLFVTVLEVNILGLEFSSQK
jgi:hypothetical protein